MNLNVDKFSEEVLIHDIFADNVDGIDQNLTAVEGKISVHTVS